MKKTYQTPPQRHRGQSLWPWSSGRSFCQNGRPYPSQAHTPSEPQWRSQHYAPEWQTAICLVYITDASELCIHIIYFMKTVKSTFICVFGALPATHRRWHWQWEWAKWQKAQQRQWRSLHLPQTRPGPKSTQRETLETRTRYILLFIPFRIYIKTSHLCRILWIFYELFMKKNMLYTCIYIYIY